MRTPFLPLLLLAVLPACGEDAAGGWPGEMVDSAGVTVVRNPLEPLWTPEEGWWVEEALRVGDDPAVPESLFGYVADATLDGEGRILVLDQQAQAVRVFGPDGTFLRTLGGPGEGPGELGRLTTSLLARDGEVAVVDWVQHRLTRYAAEGEVLPSTLLPHAPGTRSWWEPGPDGGYWFRTLVMALDQEGRWTGQDHLQRWVPGSDPDTLLTFGYQTTDLGARGAPRLPPVVESPAWAVLPGGTVAWTTLSSTRIRLEGPDGALRLVGREAWMGRAPSPAEEAVLEERVGERLEMLGGSADAVDQMPVDHPEILPVLTDLHAGPEGTLWVQRAGPVGDVHPMALNTPDPPRGWGGTVWEVLDREGRYLGSVELPPRFRLMEIRGDRILGVQADANLVDQVVVLNLVRPGTP